jgi:hypothetical protein
LTDKRLLLVLPAPMTLALLLAACGEEAPADDSRSASGEVLEGTISDAMLPLDRIRSEPPLEDPEAFAEVQSKADEAAGGATPDGEEGEAAEGEAGEIEEPPAEEAEEPAAE